MGAAIRLTPPIMKIPEDDELLLLNTIRDGSPTKAVFVPTETTPLPKNTRPSFADETPSTGLIRKPGGKDNAPGSDALVGLSPAPPVNITMSANAEIVAPC